MNEVRSVSNKTKSIKETTYISNIHAMCRKEVGESFRNFHRNSMRDRLEYQTLYMKQTSFAFVFISNDS